MTTAYYLRCADCEESWASESVNNKERPARAWRFRHKLAELRKHLEVLGQDGISIDGDVVVDDVLRLYQMDLDFLVKHDGHHVVIRDEYGKDHEIPAEGFKAYER